MREIVRRLPSDEEGVHLIDEQHDLAVGPLHLELEPAHPLGKRAAHPSTGNQPASGKLDEDRALEAPYAFAALRQPARETFGDRGLAHPRRPHENRIVRAPASQDVEEPFDLVVATDDLVDAPQGSHLGQVPPELGQGWVLARIESERGRRGNDELIFQRFDRCFDGQLDQGSSFGLLDAKLDQRRGLCCPARGWAEGFGSGCAGSDAAGLMYVELGAVCASSG